MRSEQFRIPIHMHFYVRNGFTSLDNGLYKIISEFGWFMTIISALGGVDFFNICTKKFTAKSSYFTLKKFDHFQTAMHNTKIFVGKSLKRHIEVTYKV